MRDAALSLHARHGDEADASVVVCTPMIPSLPSSKMGKETPVYRHQRHACTLRSRVGNRYPVIRSWGPAWLARRVQGHRLTCGDPFSIMRPQHNCPLTACDIRQYNALTTLPYR